VRRRLVAAASAVLVDGLFGEPPLSPHPVAAFGSLMAGAERIFYRDRREAGALHALFGVLTGVGAGFLIRSTAAATYLAVAGRALGDVALSIAETLFAGDLDAARRQLPSLVGRDTDDLDEGEIARAVVESVAENAVDALVAPVLWGALLGAPGALGYRALNTLDAVVGHLDDRYRRFGWASARLDDVANFVPARVTAGLVALVRPKAAGAIWRAVREDAPGHPSPNAGVAEAAFAAALGLRLGGQNRYARRVEERPVLGRGRRPDRDDIEAAVALVRDVGFALAAGLFVAGVIA
jgi:adenosylcobinamide-phosphate synthase